MMGRETHHQDAISTSPLPANRAFCHGLKLSVPERTKLLQSAGDLIELPLPRQFGRFTPGWLLAAKARQRRLSVHGGDRPEKPQAFCDCWKSSRFKRGFETAVSLQKRRSAGCANARCARHLVRGIAAQGDKIRNLPGVDAISRANFGGIDTRHLAGANWIEDGDAVRGKLEGVTVAARNEDSAAALFFLCGSRGKKIIRLKARCLRILKTAGGNKF